MGIRRLGQIEVKWDQLEVPENLVGITIKGEERIMFKGSLMIIFYMKVLLNLFLITKRLRINTTYRQFV